MSTTAVGLKKKKHRAGGNKKNMREKFKIFKEFSSTYDL